METDKNSVASIEATTLPATDLANKELLKQESSALLAQITVETNLEKTKDLTYLFNINHSKKAMLRQETLDDTMDSVVNEISSRVKNNPDEFDTDTLLKTATTLQTIMEKNAAQVLNSGDKPLIQLNKTDININQAEEISDPIVKGLSTTEKKNVSAFMSTLFKSQSTNSTSEENDSDDR